MGRAGGRGELGVVAELVAAVVTLANPCGWPSIDDSGSDGDGDMGGDVRFAGDGSYMDESCMDGPCPDESCKGGLKGRRGLLVAHLL